MAQIFPKWINTAVKALPFVLVGVGAVAVFVVWYWFSPLHLEVGYRPHQPIEFSHNLHTSVLDIDCKYCHYYVENTRYAGVPSTQTCLTCHEHMANKSSLKTAGIRRSWDGAGGEGTPIAWRRVHKVGDYAYFDHSAHVSVGIGCVSCHGQVNHMEVVRQEKPLSMSWCLDCHMNPAPHIRPVSEVTNMNYHQSESYRKMAEEKTKSLDPSVTNCSGCHR